MFQPMSLDHSCPELTSKKIWSLRSENRSIEILGPLDQEMTDICDKSSFSYLGPFFWGVYEKEIMLVQGFAPTLLEAKKEAVRKAFDNDSDNWKELRYVAMEKAYEYLTTTSLASLASTS